MSEHNLHFSATSVARRRKVVFCQDSATEERAGIVNAISSTLTEQNPDRAWHSVVAVGGC